MKEQLTNKQQKNNNRGEFQLLSLINLTNCRCTDVLRYTAQVKVRSQVTILRMILNIYWHSF